MVHIRLEVRSSHSCLIPASPMCAQDVLPISTSKKPARWSICHAHMLYMYLSPTAQTRPSRQEDLEPLAGQEIGVWGPGRPSVANYTHTKPKPHARTTRQPPSHLPITSSVFSDVPRLGDTRSLGLPWMLSHWILTWLSRMMSEGTCADRINWSSIARSLPVMLFSVDRVKRMME